MGVRVPPLAPDLSAVTRKGMLCGDRVDDKPRITALQL